MCARTKPLLTPFHPQLDPRYPDRFVPGSRSAGAWRMLESAAELDVLGGSPTNPLATEPGETRR